MADIYLAISETPTVVTLTSAVLNSAVASSVTVMNTVTVALDANSLSALENVTVTVGAAITGTVTVGNFPATQAVSLASVPTHAISGTVTANLNLPSFAGADGAIVNTAVLIGYYDDGLSQFRGVNSAESPLPISGNVQIVTAIPAGTNRIGVVTIGGGTVTIAAGTAQIGSVTASISNFPATQAISIASVTIGNSVTIASLPAISGTVTANTFALQGTAVTTSNFTSTTASTVLAGFNAGREVLTIFSEGPGTLFVSAGATCTTVQYQVRLSSGDYYEAPSHQSTITHSAVFQTAGTARVTEIT